MFLLNSNTIGNISSLPANIRIVKTIFDGCVNIEKLPLGLSFDKPSPILLNVSSTLDTVVSKSKFSSAISAIATITIIAYTKV